MTRIQRDRLRRAALSAALGVMWAGIATAHSTTVARAETLTFVSWGGAFQAAQERAYLEPYAEETGTTIRQASFSGEAAKIEAMVQTGNYEWDVVDVTTADVIRLCRSGALEPIDWSIVGDQERFLADMSHECGIGVSTWSGIWAYDADRVAEGPQTIADFFDVEKFPGKRALRRTPKITLEMALMADGVPPAEVYSTLETEEGLNRALAKLDTIKPHVVWWEHGEQPQQLLANGEVDYAMAYNGRVFNAIINEGKNFKIVWDGQVLDIDWLVVPAGNPRADLAMDFIRFASAPEPQGALPNLIPYGPTVVDAVGVNPEMIEHLPTAPQNFQNALVTGGEFWADNEANMTEKFEAWLAR